VPSLFAGTLQVLRGVLIGLAEIVPGVSGGTIALVVGVYQALISGAARFARAGVALLRSRFSLARSEMAGVSWKVIVPVIAGMGVGIIAGAALLEPVINDYPQLTLGVFSGLILASLWIPWRMAGRWSPRMALSAALTAVAMFFFSGLPTFDNDNPSLWVVAPAAAIAVCALVLPGVSGSFILVTLGLYQPTLQAVNDRDLGYLGVFVAGALVGLGGFVRIVQYLLEKVRAMTLAIMTGLMAGSLRALWPWQGEGRELLPPGGDVPSVALAAAAGFMVVVGLLLMERFWLPAVRKP